MKVQVGLPDIAYAAGFIDGDGCIRLKMKPCGTYDVRVQVTSTDWPIIVWLQLRWGGGQYRKVGSCRSDNPRWKPMHAWHIVGQPAVDFLVAILPYLILKKPQATLAIEAWEQRKPTPRSLRHLGVPLEIRTQREARVKEMTALNRKGN